MSARTPPEPAPELAVPPEPPPPEPDRSAIDGGDRGVVAAAAHRSWAVIRRIHLGTMEPENWVQLFKFGLVGGSGYVINLLVFAFALEYLGLHHLLAAVAAFCVAVLNNFFMNRHWTFDAGTGDAAAQAVRFFTISVFALGVNLLALALLVDILELDELPSQAAAVVVAMPFNFMGNKMWTFATGRSEAPPLLP